jgi:Ala-tRNA(Pro) deacylase
MPSPQPALESLIPPPDQREAALYDRLRALDIAWTTHAHAPVFTVEEAKELRGRIAGIHTKNLFLEDRKGGLWLVCAPEERRIDLNALSRMLGVPRFSFGSPELLAAALGILPGAVSAFALMNDTQIRVRAVFDEGMLRQGSVNFHPLRNDRTTTIAAKDLLAFARATEHEPVITALPERAA